MAEQTVSTVYVQNLEERIKIPQLKESLRAIFEEFGNVIDIIAKSNLRGKGQAFIVYDRPESAKQAIVDAQGFLLFEKPMRLALARARSDATVMRSGNPDELERHKKWRVAEKERKLAAEAEEQKRLKRSAAVAGNDATLNGRSTKIARGAGLKTTGTNHAAVVPDEYLPPNRILFIQKFPDDFDAAALTTIFARFEGFREVRMVPGRKGIGFVEYENEQGAIAAKESTANMSFNDGKNIMQVTYQRQ